MAVRRLKDATTGTLKDSYYAEFQHQRVRVSRDTGCTTKAEALRWVQQRKKEIDQNLAASQLSTRSRLTVSEAAKRYIEEHLQFADGYLDGEQYRFPKTMERLGLHIRLEDLSTADVKRYVAARQREGIAPSTINREVTGIRALWGYAMEVWEYPVRAIAWRRVRPKIPKRVPINLSREEIARLLSASSPRMASKVAFVLLTGFRRKEVKSLKWKNTDIANLRVRLIGKGNKEAVIPISPATASLLSSLWQDQSPAVFDMTNYRREWDAAREKAGLTHITFHTLRHAFATMLSAMNAPVQHIMEGLRHSDIDTTLIYTHAGSQPLSPFLERLGESLSDSLQIDFKR